MDPGTTSLSLAEVTMLMRSTLSRVFSRRAPTPRFSGSLGVQPLKVSSRGVDGWLAAISLRRCAINACCCSLILIVSRTWESADVGSKGVAHLRLKLHSRHVRSAVTNRYDSLHIHHQGFNPSCAATLQSYVLGHTLWQADVGDALNARKQRAHAIGSTAVTPHSQSSADPHRYS